MRKRNPVVRRQPCRRALMAALRSRKVSQYLGPRQQRDRRPPPVCLMLSANPNQRPRSQLRLKLNRESRSGSDRCRFLGASTLYLGLFLGSRFGLRDGLARLRSLAGPLLRPTSAGRFGYSLPSSGAHAAFLRLARCGSVFHTASVGLKASTSRSAEIARSIVARCCSSREITLAISFTSLASSCLSGCFSKPLAVVVSPQMVARPGRMHPVSPRI